MPEYTILVQRIENRRVHVEADDLRQAMALLADGVSSVGYRIESGFPRGSDEEEIAYSGRCQKCRRVLLDGEVVIYTIDDAELCDPCHRAERKGGDSGNCSRAS